MASARSARSHAAAGAPWGPRSRSVPGAEERGEPRGQRPRPEGGEVVVEVAVRGHEDDGGEALRQRPGFEPGRGAPARGVAGGGDEEAGGAGGAGRRRRGCRPRARRRRAVRGRRRRGRARSRCPRRPAGWCWFPRAPRSARRGRGRARGPCGAGRPGPWRGARDGAKCAARLRGRRPGRRRQRRGRGSGASPRRRGRRARDGSAAPGSGSPPGRGRVRALGPELHGPLARPHEALERHLVVDPGYHDLPVTRGGPGLDCDDRPRADSRACSCCRLRPSRNSPVVARTSRRPFSGSGP